MRFRLKKEPGDKVRHLNQFPKAAGGVEILSGLPAGSLVPDVWRGLLETSGSDRVRRVVAQWAEVSGDRMRNTTSYPGKHLLEVDLIRTGALLSLLYSIKNRQGVMRYCVGGNPIGVSERARLEWDRVPESLRTF